MLIRSRESRPFFPSLNIKSAVEKMGDSFFGSAPSIFVGRAGYPNVFVGPLASLRYDEKQESPSEWFGKGYYDIINMRSMMLRTKYRHSVYGESRFTEMNREIAMSAKPADVELSFRSKPGFHVALSSYVQPMGPSVTIDKASLAGNVRISPKIEKIVTDELKAAEALNALYESGVDVYKGTTILSSGALGVAKKLVPTRWSITASDDTIGKHLIAKIREMPPLERCLVYESTYMDNHFIVVLLPGPWEFENFEAWSPGSNWSFSNAVEIAEEYEPFYGRTAYAEKEAGGYYASRLGVTEGIVKLDRQCKAVVFREIG
ncbi:MAG: hypothetical protein HY365_03220, partial [Candidatus Aenigmarchaeota archaeon]|nr:hypothetical protein [Candidatus Aenigmarchaeota archaeon]